MLIKPITVLRKKSHLVTRLELRDERVHATRLIPWLALVNISFAVVDCFVAPNGNYLGFFLIRIFAVLVSRVGFLLTRGRTKYGVRLFITVAPYIFGVEYIMFRHDLLLTPYFAGLALVIVTSTMLFPVKAKIAYPVYGACILPVILWMLVSPLPSNIDTLNIILMSLGTVYVCAVNSNQVHKDFVARMSAQETLARSIGTRNREIREKANELLKRKIFESQFSPQVVQAVIFDPTLIREMKRLQIVTFVIDIENSTSKATALSPQNYKEVVEEVLDVFSASCLKWNVTLDKFTGDGVQAFAGAPIAQPDDFMRVMNAAFDTVQMLKGRRDLLEPLWEGELNVRLAVCRGEALVGFVGKGAFKSYTAIGDMVSFTHRLVGVAQPWSVAAYSWDPNSQKLEAHSHFQSQETSVVGLKGFSGREFRVAVYQPRLQLTQSLDLGRCKKCSTPLVMEDSTSGLPKVFCPACNVNSSWRNIAA